MKARLSNPAHRLGVQVRVEPSRGNPIGVNLEPWARAWFRLKLSITFPAADLKG